MKKLLVILFVVFGFSAITNSQTTVKKVVLQAFWWDYHNNAYTHKWCNYLTELAPRLKSMGIDAVWIPPSSKNESPSYVGYAPFDHYDLGDKFQKGSTATRLGTKDELLRMIAVMHANGIEVIQDVVLNHISSAGSGSGVGGQDPNSFSITTNSGYKNFRFVSYSTPATTEAQNNYWSRSGRWPKNFWNFYPNANNNCTTGDICSAYFGPDISYENNSIGTSSNVIGFNPAQTSGYMRNGGREWISWMKKQTGVDGFRWDAVKHFPTYVQEDYSYNLKNTLPVWAKGGQNMFNVGEWVGSKLEIDNYVNAIATPSGDKMMGTFDFNLRAFDPNGGLYGMVYGMGNFNMSNLPGAQQTQRVTYYANTNTYVHRTVPFVNNHDTFRPNLDNNGNYAGWNGSQELSAHIEPNEPRMSTAYAAMMAMDGNPQIFYEDLFDIGYNGNRWTHDPKSLTSLPVRDDLVNLLWCHQNLDFKSGPYQVPFSNNDYLIISRAGRAIIGITDSWDTWQTQNIYTSFAAGTVLKDYSGANANATVTVDANGYADILTPPVDPSLNPAARHGYSVWAPVGQDADVYTPPRATTTTQEWEMANDMGDSHVYSLGQGGALPASSTNFRIAGKIFVESGKVVTYTIFPQTTNKSLYIGLYDNGGILLSSKSGTGTLTANFTPNYTGWITLKVRNNVASNPTQKCWVNVTYTAPQVILNAGANGPGNLASFWSGNGADSDWHNPNNWEEGIVPNADSDVIIPFNAFPQPAIVGNVAVNNIAIEEGAHIFIDGTLEINNELLNLGTLSGKGSYSYRGEAIELKNPISAEYTIYPNPNEGQFQIVANGIYNGVEILKVSILSPDGKLIATLIGNLDMINTEILQVFSDKASGVYFVQVVDKQMPSVLRFVKE